MRSVFLFLLLFFSLKSNAAIEIVSVSGASFYDSKDKIIYAGTAGINETNAAGCTGTNTCNTCTAAVGTNKAFGACNREAVRIQTELKITFKSDNSNGTARITTDSDTSIGTGVSYTSGSNVTLSATWQEVCQDSGISITTNQCNDGSETLKVGVDTDNNGTIDDVLNVTINIKDLNNNTDTDTVPDSVLDGSIGSSTIGVNDFQLFPGDEKAYIRSFDASSTTATGLKVRQLIVLVQEATVLNNGCGSRNLLANNSNFYPVDINEEDETLKSDKLEGGLENNRTYVMTIGTKDQAGNVGEYFDINTVCTENKHTVTPQEVFGLLEDEVNCFISTAAYGSPFHNKVVNFREFRDKILKKYSWGKSFISFYYKHSPHYAKMIEDNSVLRFLARVALFPFWLLSILSLQLGLWGALFICTVCFFFSILLFRLFFKFKKKLIVFSLIFFQTQIVFSQSDFFDLENEPETREKEIINTPPKEPPFTDADEEIESLEKSKDKTSSGTEEFVVEDKFDEKNPNKWREYQRIPEEERLKELSDQGLFRITKKGEYVYDVKPSPQESAASLRFATATFPFLENPDSGVTFEEIYGDDTKYMLMADYEWQFFQKLGKLGVKLATGFLYAEGQGQFSTPVVIPGQEPTTEAEETFTFIFMPNTLSLVYRLDLFNKQFLVPFAEAGISYFTFIESEEGEQIKFGGAPHFNFAVGGSFLLDLLGRDLIVGIDRDYGINHMWLTAEYRRFEAIETDFDFTDDIFSAGIMVEF